MPTLSTTAADAKDELYRIVDLPTTLDMNGVVNYFANIHPKVDNASSNESLVARELKRKRNKEDSEESDGVEQDDKSNLKRAEKPQQS